jgi:hypothetical protein
MDAPDAQGELERLVGAWLRGEPTGLRHPRRQLRKLLHGS